MRSSRDAAGPDLDWSMIIAHTLINAVAFVGYALLAPHVSWLR